MGIVITDDKNYVNIAEKIREKVDPDATYKPEEMPSGIDDVYKAGQKSEYDRFWDDLQQNGERTFYEYAFYRWGNESFKPKYPFKPIIATAMFNSSRLTGDVTKVMDLDLSLATSIMNLYYASSYITRIGKIDCRAVNQNHISFCSLCSALETVDEVVFNDDPSQQFVGLTTWSFTNDTALKNIKITGAIGWNTNFQWCPLTLESAKSVINALKDYSGTDKAGTYTVTFSSSTRTLLTEAGAIFNGMTWDNYVSIIGWNI